jgi:transposase
MPNITTIGLDLAKNVFQVHGVDKSGRKIFGRKLRRDEVLSFFQTLPPCTVAMEACATSNYWSREIGVLGHRCRIIPAQYVKPFVKRGKTDAYDAEAIAIASSQEGMRFVPIKSEKQQAAAQLFKTRSLLVRQRSRSGNALRGLVAEYGTVVRTGAVGLSKLVDIVRGNNNAVPDEARFALLTICDLIDALSSKIERLDERIRHLAKENKDTSRLLTIPGVGPIVASAVAAYVPDPAMFKSARHFASWIGLTPKQNSSGGSLRSGKISKMGNTELRSLLFLAGKVLLLRSKRAFGSDWLERLAERRPLRVAAIAVANKVARIIWAVLSKGEAFQTREPVKPIAG